MIIVWPLDDFELLDVVVGEVCEEPRGPRSLNSISTAAPMLLNAAPSRGYTLLTAASACGHKNTATAHGTFLPMRSLARPLVSL